MGYGQVGDARAARSSTRGRKPAASHAASSRHARFGLPATASVTMLPTMFIVSEEAATAIRTAYEQEGELSAAIEVRRLFPGITDNVKAREHARIIAGWLPLPPRPSKSRKCNTRSSTQ